MSAKFVPGYRLLLRGDISSFPMKIKPLQKYQGLCLAIFWLVATTGCGKESTDHSAPATVKTTDLGQVVTLTRPWKVDGDIDWQVADILGRMSKAAYLDPEEANASFRQLGFDEITPSISGSMVSYIVTLRPVTVIVFRGTDDLEDWLANLKVIAQDVPGGQIHGGFYEAYQSLRRNIHQALSEADPKFLWISGHSLGGALAVACAHDLTEANVPVDGVVTFGQPMVAKADLANHLSSRLSKYQRFINFADIVPRIPPLFTHTGSLVWFTKDGIVRSEIEATQHVQRKRTGGRRPVGPPALDEDQFRELQERLRRGSNHPAAPRSGEAPGALARPAFPPIDDHAMGEYLQSIARRGANDQPNDLADQTTKPEFARPPKPPTTGRPLQRPRRPGLP